MADAKVLVLIVVGLMACVFFYHLRPCGFLRKKVSEQALESYKRKISKNHDSNLDLKDPQFDRYITNDSTKSMLLPPPASNLQWMASVKVYLNFYF